MVSLDSSFLIDLLNGTRPARDKARELDDSAEPRRLTAPVAAEVLLGGHRLGGAYQVRAEQLINSLAQLPFDLASCHEAAKIAATLYSRGTPIGEGDLFIAAITKRHGERLLTRDRVFGTVPGLQIETY
jgi:predicted nucleic acid-binding protein